MVIFRPFALTRRQNKKKMEQEAYRHVPYDIEVEQALLGAVFVDNQVVERISSVLKAEDFYDPLHQRLYEVMTHAADRGSMVLTPLTVHALMKADPGLMEVGGHAYLAGLAQAAPAIPNVRDLARILHDLAVRRALIGIGEDIVNTAYEAPHDKTPKDQIEEAERALYRISESSKYGAGPIDFSESLKRTVELAEMAQQRGGRISGLATGFVDIDNLLGGLQPSDLLILAGRPGMGKTSLATNMAVHAARAYLRDIENGAEVPSGAPILFFSLEMAAQQIAARILSEQTEIEMWKIRNGRFNEQEWEKFVLSTQELSNLPLYIDDTGGISVAQIAARARRLQREKKIGCIMIDHIQLVAGSGRAENRVQEITEISKALKVLAKDLNVPVVALSQLSRSVDSRDDKRPVLSDLRESGSIEQDADVVMFVYREEYYLASREPEAGSPEHVKWTEKLDRATGKAEVLVEKHRHGATNRIELQFDGRYTRFSNLVQENQFGR
ncbi:MAG: replicative DNA helicase [Alphaproteobacteria bacterium]|nr:replicative DNA helicase [Alphaproteobacteria bacterium]MBL7099904.1 replicative DNA helicase [Alphaproteobacteria bacterium]